MKVRWICPKCKWEFQKEQGHCPLCNIALVEEREKEQRTRTKEQKFIEVFRTTDQIKLCAAEATLRCAKIRFATLGETGMSSVFGLFSPFVSSVRIEVAENDMGRATQAIARAFRGPRQTGRQ